MEPARNAQPIVLNAPRVAFAQHVQQDSDSMDRIVPPALRIASIVQLTLPFVLPVLQDFS